MTTFLQFHLLTPYPPSNPNRDDQGRPKQAMVGGHPRLRISSQSLKRAIRESTHFADELEKFRAVRTRRPARWLMENLDFSAYAKKQVDDVLKSLTEAFGKLDANKTKAEALPVLTTPVFLAPEEFEAMAELATKALAHGEKLPPRAELATKVLRRTDTAIDLAMFGRMLAGESGDGPTGASKLKIKEFEREAAAQISHAFTTHRAVAEDDYFTAVDDLNKKDDTGAAHVNVAGFGSGVYYLYANVNVDLLVENLAGDRALAATGLEALARALATAVPRGKQNSFADRPLAIYARAERGRRQPRDLSGAFFTPVPLTADCLKRASISALEDMAARIDRAYGPMVEAHKVMNVLDEIGSLDEIAAFAAEAVDHLDGQSDG